MNEFISKLISTAIHEHVQKLSVGAALLYNSKLLILKRNPDDFMPNIYELPGGGLEGEESLLDALKRELREETNCNINNITGYLGYIDFPSSKGLLTRRFNFLVEPQLPLSIQLTEHADYKWIFPDEVEQYEITRQTRKIIESIHKGNIHYF